MLDSIWTSLVLTNIWSNHFYYDFSRRLDSSEILPLGYLFWTIRGVYVFKLVTTLPLMIGLSRRKSFMITPWLVSHGIGLFNTFFSVNGSLMLIVVKDSNKWQDTQWLMWIARSIVCYLVMSGAYWSFKIVYRAQINIKDEEKNREARQYGQEIHKRKTAKENVYTIIV